MVQVNGSMVEDPKEVEAHIIHFFKVLYSKQQMVQPDLTALQLEQLSVQHSQQLEDEVSHNEVKDAVWDCDPSKAPGYDWYNFKFVRMMWDIIGSDIIKFVVEFFTSYSLPKAVNRTWVTLIPKKIEAKEISD